MKKIAIFAIFLMATLMTFGQLVPDQQFLAPCRVKLLTTKFTRFIPANTLVYYGTPPAVQIYITTADAVAGQSLASMIIAGTAVLPNASIADTGYLNTTGTDHAYGNYTFSGTNYFTGLNYMASKFLFTTDSLKPITNNTGFLGSPTKQVGSIYSHYCTGDWGAFTKATGTYTKFGIDSATTAIVSGNITGATIGVSGVDTVTSAPVGSIIYRAADSTLWVKIKATGTKAQRWNKISHSK
jgi:hypothetical protein